MISAFRITAMAKFSSGSDASTAALAAIDAKLQTIETTESLELFFQWVRERAIAQQALASGGGGSSSTITANTAIAYGAGPTTPTTQRMAVASDSGLSTETTLLQVRDAIKAQIDIASSIWTDNTNAYFVRRDLVNEGTGVITITWTDSTGNASAAPSTGARPLSTVDKDVISAYYDVITTGTGYTAGDLLARIAIVDTNPTTPTSVFIWLNLTAGTTISAPTAAHVELQTENVGARQVGTWTVGLSAAQTLATVTNLARLGGQAIAMGSGTRNAGTQRMTIATDDLVPTSSTDLGATTDTAATTNIGAFSLISLFKRLLNVTLAFGVKTVANSLSIAPASDAAFTLAAESGFLSYRNTALTNTAVAVKASAGSVMGWNFINVNTVPVYVKFYDLAQGSVTVGSSAVVMTLAIPAGDGINAGMFYLEPQLIPTHIFGTAISMACVTGLADSSSTAPSTPIHVGVRYK